MAVVSYCMLISPINARYSKEFIHDATVLSLYDNNVYWYEVFKKKLSLVSLISSGKYLHLLA